MLRWEEVLASYIGCFYCLKYYQVVLASICKTQVVDTTIESRTDPDTVEHLAEIFRREVCRVRQ